MDAYSYIKNHVFVKLKPSKYSGIGVFSIRDVPSNTFLFKKWEGETGLYPISQSQLNSLPRELKLHILDIFMYSSDFPDDTNVYVVLTNGCHWVYTTPYFFVNSDIDKANIDKDTHKTLKKILSNREIVSNYRKCERIDSKSIL